MSDRIKISRDQASFAGEPREEKVRLQWKREGVAVSVRTEVYSRGELEAEIKRLEAASLPVLPQYREALTWFTPIAPEQS
jgi:hypothetical protein